MIKQKTRYVDTSGQKKENRVVGYLSDPVMEKFSKQMKKDLFWSTASFLEHIILEYIDKNKGTGSAQCQHCGGTISNEVKEKA